MNGAECLLRTLIENGVNLCLMNPGTSEMQFVSALDRVPGMRGVLCLFEGVCSGAADGYARMTGRPAATLLHLGPGLANSLSNFHNARKARSPVVSIVGEHSTGHLRYNAPLTSDTEARAHGFRLGPHAHESGRHGSHRIGRRRRGARGPRAGCNADHSGGLFLERGWASRAPPAAVFPAYSRNRHDPRGRRYPTVRPTRGLLLSGSALQRRALEAAGRLRAATGVRVFSDRYAARLERGAGIFAAERIPYFPEPAQAMLAELRHLILVEATPPVSFFGYPGLRSSLTPEDCELHVLASAEGDGPAALEALAEECGAKTPWHGSEARAQRPALPSGERLTADAIGRTLGALLPAGAILSDEAVSSNEAIWPHLGEAPRHDHLPVTGGSIGQGLPVAVGAALACPGRK